MDWTDGETDTVRAEVHPTDNADIREALFNAFAEEKLPLLELTRVRASLEDVFLELTGGDAPAASVPAQPEASAVAAQPAAGAQEAKEASAE